MTTPRAHRERRLIAVLASTLGVLIAGIALVLREDAREPDTAGALPLEGVSRIAIERQGSEEVVLVREGTDWRVSAPCALDADEARIEPLLAALAAGGAGYAVGEVDLDAAGLDAPLAVVRLDEERVLLGGTDLGGERRYARRGERVTLVPEWSLSLVSGGMSAFAALAPFDAPPTRLDRFEPEPARTRTAESTSDPNGGSTTEAAAPSGGSPDPAPWSVLLADRIARWPVPGAPPILERARLDATFADGTRRTLDIARTERWSALRLDGADCAYLFGGDALPPELYR